MMLARPLLLLLFAMLAFGQVSSRDPRWRTVGAGASASRPATCATNRDVYICNGAGCTANGEYHYCTAANTWTVSGGGIRSPATGGTGADLSATTSGALFYWNASLFAEAAGSSWASGTSTLTLPNVTVTSAASLCSGCAETAVRLKLGNNSGVLVGTQSYLQANFHKFTGAIPAGQVIAAGVFLPSLTNTATGSPGRVSALEGTLDIDPGNAQAFTGGLFGGRFFVDHEGNGTVDFSRGVFGLVANGNGGGTGTMTEGIAVRGLVQNFGALGTFPTAVALSAGSATGNITNSYGLKVDDQTVGTNNWAIQTGKGKVELGEAATSLTSLLVTDDFISGNATSGSIGQLGWLISGTGGTVALQTPETNRPGILRSDTGAVAANKALLILNNSAANAGFLPAATFEMIWMGRLNTNDTNTTVRAGASDNATIGAPVDGLYFEKLDADTSWFGVCRATTQTRTTAVATIDTAFHKFRVRRVSGTTIGFTIDAGTEQTCTTNIPTAGIIPVIYITTSAAASKTLDTDYFHLLISGLTR